MIDEQRSENESRDFKETPYLARKLAPTVVPGHGHGRLLPGGQPGHKGAGGRPPAAFKDWVREIFESDAAKAQVRRILEDADHPAFSSVFGKLLVYVLGPPKAAESDDAIPHVFMDI